MTFVRDVDVIGAYEGLVLDVTKSERSTQLRPRIFFCPGGVMESDSHMYGGVAGVGSID